MSSCGHSSGILRIVGGLFGVECGDDGSAAARPAARAPLMLDYIISFGFGDEVSMLCCSTRHTVTHTLTKTCSNTPFCREGERRGPNPARKRNSKYMKNGTEVELLWAKPPRQDTQPALLAHQLQPRPLTAHLNRDGTPKSLQHHQFQLAIAIWPRPYVQ